VKRSKNKNKSFAVLLSGSYLLITNLNEMQYSETNKLVILQANIQIGQIHIFESKLSLGLLSITYERGQVKNYPSNARLVIFAIG